MDTLHTVMRTIRGETKTRHHLSVFREFLAHLDRVTRARTARPRSERMPRANGASRTARNGKR